MELCRAPPPTHQQLPLHTLILLGLGDPLLLVAVAQDALTGELSAVAHGLCSHVMQPLLYVVIHRFVRWGWRRWRSRHHQVQLFLGFHQVVLGFSGLWRGDHGSNENSCPTACVVRSGMVCQ